MEINLSFRELVIKKDKRINFMMLIVIPSLIIVFLMLVVAYVVNYNSHKSARDVRYTIKETNLYRREDDEKGSKMNQKISAPLERERPIVEKKTKSREPVMKKPERRPRENIRRNVNDPEGSGFKNE